MAAPLRLASLVSSNSDILAALGLSAQIVAADNHSDAPGLEGARRVGNELDIDVTALLETQPDLILASLSVPGMERVVAKLEEIGVPLLVLDPTNMDEAMHDVLRIGEAVGYLDRAAHVVQQWRSDFSALRGQYPRSPRVVVEWWPRPIINATKESWVTDLLAGLGAVNAFADRPGRSAPMTLDEVRAAHPDLIVCSWCGARKLRPEVIEARGLGVPVLPVLESGLGRPGPRLVEGARQIHKALQQLNFGEIRTAE